MACFFLAEGHVVATLQGGDERRVLSNGVASPLEQKWKKEEGKKKQLSMAIRHACYKLKTGGIYSEKILCNHNGSFADHRTYL